MTDTRFGATEEEWAVAREVAQVRRKEDESLLPEITIYDIVLARHAIRALDQYRAVRGDSGSETLRVVFDGTGQSCKEVTAMLGGHDAGNARWKSCTYDGGWIDTPHGWKDFGPGDWIVKYGDDLFDVVPGES